MKFILPAIGSTITHAIESPRALKSSVIAFLSLNETVRVCLAKSAGTPGELGTPSVNAPEPAFTNRESEWP